MLMVAVLHNLITIINSNSGNLICIATIIIVNITVILCNIITVIPYILIVARMAMVINTSIVIK